MIDGIVDGIGLEKNAEFGFWIAALIISLAWNIGWRHYIRYYIGLAKPVPRRTEIGIRLFYFVCLVSSAYMLGATVVSRNYSLQDIASSLLIGAVITASFFLLDVIFRWKWLNM